jgi:hypothetical protein
VGQYHHKDACKWKEETNKKSQGEIKDSTVLVLKRGKGWRDKPRNTGTLRRWRRQEKTLPCKLRREDRSDNILILPE